MSAPNRPTSHWSSSLSTITKATGFSNQTTPLITIRRKLLRQKNLSQHMTKSKHNIEELFKLYYSTDIKFDRYQRQIVTGTRISTAKTAPLPQNNPTNRLDSKQRVSREQTNAVDVKCNEQQPINNEIKTKQSVPDRLVKKSIVNLPIPSSHPNLSTATVFVAVPNLPKTSSSTEQNELCDLSLLKSVIVLNDDDSSDFPENIKTTNTNSNIIPRPISSLLTISPGLAPPPSLMIMNDDNRKDLSSSSYTSFSTMPSIQQQNRPAIVTGSTVTGRQRSPIKQSSNRLPGKLNMTMTTNLPSQQSTPKTRPSSVYNTSSIESDMPKDPAHVGAQRIVSIPSKCSRYVLVTFPEVPLRYSPPSYVERLLLPERFPTLFQNILQSHDHSDRKS